MMPDEEGGVKFVQERGLSKKRVCIKFKNMFVGWCVVCSSRLILKSPRIIDLLHLNASLACISLKMSDN